MARSSELWLPDGHHWDLHIDYLDAEDAGAHEGGGWKLCWHTTQSDWDTAAAVARYVRDSRKAPHFVIGGDKDLEHPVVYQQIPLNRAARALRNDSVDGYQTNKANVIQVEICGFSGQSHLWGESKYKALANLFELIRHRRYIENWSPQDFSEPRRMGDREWVLAKGHVGHSMAPDNDHVDPGRFREGLLQQLVRTIPASGWAL